MVVKVLVFKNEIVGFAMILAQIFKKKKNSIGSEVRVLMFKNEIFDFAVILAWNFVCFYFKWRCGFLVKKEREREIEND